MIDAAKKVIRGMWEKSGRVPTLNGQRITLETAVDEKIGLAAFAAPIFAIHDALQAPNIWLGPVVLVEDEDSVSNFWLKENKDVMADKTVGYPILGLFSLSFEASCAAASEQGQHDTLDLTIPMNIAEKDPLALLRYASRQPEERILPEVFEGPRP